MKKVIFLDRDGAIIREPEDEQIDSFEKLSFLPRAITNLSRIAAELEYTLVLVTNQDGLGTDSFPEETFWPAHNKMLQILKDEGVIFEDIFIDRTFPHENAPTRKPGTAMLNKYIHGSYDMPNSWVIGDRASDIALAENLGCKGIRISSDEDARAALTTTDWGKIYRFLKGIHRVGKVTRTTTETRIEIEIDLDGSGQSTISTGIGFFDHMLEQIARHGSIDLTVKVDGDLDIDEHHTIEDTALALGEAFDKALGDRKGIARYGFLLPMDESLAQVAIDFGGRPWLNWNATFEREKVGAMPTEMFMHFFKSFTDTARCNLDITVVGDNEHHKIEAIFKAFARALRMAVSQTGDSSIPSTKGVL